MNPIETTITSIETSLTGQFGPLKLLSKDIVGTIAYVIWTPVTIPSDPNGALAFVNALDIPHNIDLYYSATTHYIDCRIEL